MTTSWDSKHASATSKPQACSLLLQHKHLLPKTGTALDLASGRGGNTIELAKCGLTVTACDSSEVAIQILKQEVKNQNLTIEAIVQDAETTLTKNQNTYDLILISKFLDRQLTPQITKALKQHGIIYYQTFTQDSQTGPTNKDYKLKQNELLHMFTTTEYLIIHYQEHSIHTPTSTAELIAQKK